MRNVDIVAPASSDVGEALDFDWRRLIGDIPAIPRLVMLCSSIAPGQSSEKPSGWHAISFNAIERRATRLTAINEPYRSIASRHPAVANRRPTYRGIIDAQRQIIMTTQLDVVISRAALIESLIKRQRFDRSGISAARPYFIVT